MFVQNRCILALLAGCVSVSGADLLRLKENAAIFGKILTEKPDQIVVDIGYTALVVPKSQIIEVTTGQPASERELITASASTAVVSTDAEAKTVLPSPALSLEKSALFADGGTTRSDQTVRELVSVLGEAVVQVRTPSGLGSGFILNPDGCLITNFHVIENETQISVEVFHQRTGQLDRRTYRQVRIVALNKFADLALLKIEDKDAPKFASVPLGDSEGLGVGERVFAIGSPMGLERTVTEGIVSTKTRPMQGELYLQTTTQINPGNSGGPLFNLRGEVVGVTNMKLAFGEGLGFAIPVQTVKAFLTHRDAFAYDNDNPSSPYRYLEPPSRISKLAAPQ